MRPLVLREPIHLRARETLRGYRLTLADDYAGGWQQPPGVDNRGGYGVVRAEKGAHHARVQDCEIVGPPREWWQERIGKTAWAWPVRGLSVLDADGVEIENVHVESFPAEGLMAREFRGLTVRGLTVSRCLSGVLIDWPRVRGNLGLRIDGLTVIDTRAWNEPSGIGPSVLEPSVKVGGTSMAAIGLVDAEIARVHSIGEAKGLKVSDSAWVAFSGLRVPQLWLGGCAVDYSPWPGYCGPRECRGYRVVDSVIGESTFGWDATRTSDPVSLHLNGRTAESLRVERTTILAPRPGVLLASWIPPGQAWAEAWRYETVQATAGFAAVLGEGVRLLDMEGDEREPVWTSADASSSITEEVPAERVRLKPQWKAG